MIVVLGLLVNNATFSLYRRSQEHHNMNGHPQPSGSYMHPTQQAIHMGHFAATPGLPFGQQTMGWHDMQEAYGEQKRLEYNRSPTKECRGRSRSPEKKRVAS